jgi:SOS-response transcriptional repressor LexA
MKLAQILARIDLRLKELGLSDAAASRLAGKSDAIRNMRRALNDKKGKGGANIATIEALARALDVSEEWLMSGAGDAKRGSVAIERNILEVKGVAEAGAWRETAPIKSRGTLKVQSDDRFPPDAQFLLEIGDNSMDAAAGSPIFKGNLVHCVDHRSAMLTLRSGQIVAVSRTDVTGKVETSLKRLELHDGFMELKPESSEPLFKSIRLEVDQVGVNKNCEILGIVIAVIQKLSI